MCAPVESWVIGAFWSVILVSYLLGFACSTTFPWDKSDIFQQAHGKILNITLTKNSLIGFLFLYPHKFFAMGSLSTKWLQAVKSCRVRSCCNSPFCSMCRTSSYLATCLQQAGQEDMVQVSWWSGGWLPGHGQVRLLHLSRFWWWYLWWQEVLLWSQSVVFYLYLCSSFFFSLFFFFFFLFFFSFFFVVFVLLFMTLSLMMMWDLMSSDFRLTY